MKIGRLIPDLFEVSMPHSTPRGIRNNNPLNLKISSSPWKGKCGNDGTFETFRDASFGLRAAYKNIQTWLKRRPNLTVKDLIYLWCPDKTKDYYLGAVQHLGNFVYSQKLSNFELDDYVRLIRAMCIVENGSCPYSFSYIKNAIQIK